MTVRAWTPETPATGTAVECPEWCVEHYAGDTGASNHSGAWRSLTVGGADSGAVLLLSTWRENRRWPDGTVDTVGIIQRGAEDVELTPNQMREFAGHLLALADEVEHDTTTPVTAQSGNAAVQVTVLVPEESREVELVVKLPSGPDKVLLSPAGARQLGSALLAAGKQPGRPSRRR